MTVQRDSRVKTVWIWPSGLFPRRLIYWLKAKSLPASLVYSDTNKSGELNFQIILLDMEQGALVPARANIEDRPKGYSLPTIRVAGSDRLITQSSAVMEYLEECYPPSDGYRDLAGATLSPEVRSSVRAIVQLVTEVIMWLGVEVRHTDERSLSWSGMSKDQMSPAAGEDGKRQYKLLLSKLEDWVRVDIEERKTLSLAGVQDMPTLADFSMAAMVEYEKEMYGIDMLQGYVVLTEWFDRYSSSPFYVDRQEIGQIEREGIERLFVRE